ncbi:MAG: response regulator [Aequorivita sp.]|nr:response regulator [Aequorivita sp.]
MEIATTVFYTQELDKNSYLITLFLIASSLLLVIVLVLFYLFYKSKKKYIQSLTEKNAALLKANEEAEQLSKHKTQFFSTISHELRTPLYGVIGLSSILLEDEKLKSHQEDLKCLKFSADYLLTLINDVLTLNKSETSNMTLENVSFNLRKLLENIQKTFALNLEQKNNKLILEIDEAIPLKMYGDSVKISQIMMNLIGNAIKFNQNGTIRIKIELLEKLKNDYLRIKFSIIDNGIGIPKEKQESIFEEFSKVENRNHNYQGTGLGLTIVKKLLALFNSEIKLLSDTGQGSLFYFELDLQKDSDASKTLPESDYSNISLNNKHILIVDDNKINQKVTQKILEKRNFKCSFADDGAEAIAQTQKYKYDLILMDVHMPNIDGIEATKSIRTFNTTTPIVAFTAVEVDEIRNSIFDSGMNDIIVKPYVVSQFLNTILKNIHVMSAA